VALVVVFLVRTAHFSPGVVGLLVAVSNAGALLGALAARRVARAVGTARALQLSALAGGIAGLLIPLTPTGNARPDRRYPAGSFLRLGPLGALLAGFLGTVLGVRLTLWILFIGFALSGTMLLSRRMLADRNLPAEPAAADSAERTPQAG
jgi:MFS-type transporter involved in bile tolerance (Atg22 family)